MTPGRCPGGFGSDSRSEAGAVLALGNQLKIVAAHELLAGERTLFAQHDVNIVEGSELPFNLSQNLLIFDANELSCCEHHDPSLGRPGRRQQ